MNFNSPLDIPPWGGPDGERKRFPSGSLLSQARSGTPCSFSWFDSDTPPRSKQQQPEGVSREKKTLLRLSPFCTVRCGPDPPLVDTPQAAPGCHLSWIQMMLNTGYFYPFMQYGVFEKEKDKIFTFDPKPTAYGIISIKKQSQNPCNVILDVHQITLHSNSKL